MALLTLMLLACTGDRDPASTWDTPDTEGLAHAPLAVGQVPSLQPTTACVRDHAWVGETLYDSIQAAVDAAWTGARITICDGVFRESLHLTRDVTLRSEHGLGFVFLVGSGAGSVISVEGASVGLVGLDITTGGGDPWRDPDGRTLAVGGGVYAADAPLLRLEDVRIHHNAAERGGGLFTADVDRVELQDVELTVNNASERGGGASLSGGEVVASGLWIRLSDAPTGGALVLEGASASLDGLRVEDCSATDEGGGLALIDSDLILTGASIQRTSADYGAAVHARSSRLTADGSTEFTDNDGGTSGGALFLRDSDLVLSGTALVGNNADHGGAAYVLGGTASLNGVRIADNHGYRGGGLYVTESAQVSLDGGTTVTDNTADAWAGGLAVVGEATLSAVDASVSGNAAPYGGGVLASEVTVTLGSDCTIQDNVATSGGGGIYANAARIAGNGARLSGNHAPQGGALLLEIDAEYVGRGDRIVDNTADRGAGLVLFEGAIARMEDVEVARNLATDRGGGALLLEQAISLSCLDCDWGLGDQDNGPQDIVDVDETFAAPATFTCDGDGCEGSD